MWPHWLELTQTDVSASTQVLSKPRAGGGGRGSTCTRCLTLKLFTIPQNPKCCRGGFAPAEPRPSLSVPLVDPRQLLHDLDDLVHGGLALHAAAVVDLEPRQHRVGEAERKQAEIYITYIHT